MIESMLQNATAFRLGGFVGLYLLMLVWETLAPRRTPLEARFPHAARNLLLNGLNVLVVRLVVPLAPVAAAAWLQMRGIGLFAKLELPVVAEWILSIVLLDLAIYGQHVLFHKMPLLWRLHQVHHSDIDFDASTGIRFHPIEILLSLGIKFALIAVLGASPEAVILFELILNLCAVFNHSNVYLPPALDRVLRLVLVTPDMHRVHHTTYRDETDSNYGFNVPWWDRIFGTYIAQPRDGHTDTRIGLESFRELDSLHLTDLLGMPLRDAPVSNTSDQ